MNKVILSAVFDQLHNSLVAGTVPLLGQDPEQTANLLATHALNDQPVHLILDRFEGQIYYLAVPSALVLGGGHATPLSAALPNHPAHQGDGIYVLNSARRKMAVVKERANLFALPSTESVERSADLYGLAIVVVDDLQNAWAFESFHARRNARRQRITSMLDLVAVMTVLVSVCIYGFALWVERAGERVQGGGLEHVVAEFQYVSPLSEQLAHFQQISATVVRAGGWIEEYVWRPKTGESFRISLPGWVSRDYIEALGQGVVTEYSIADNLVTVTKGKQELGEKPQPSEHKT